MRRRPSLAASPPLFTTRGRRRPLILYDLIPAPCRCGVPGVLRQVPRPARPPAAPRLPLPPPRVFVLKMEIPGKLVKK